MRVCERNIRHFVRRINEMFNWCGVLRDRENYRLYGGFAFELILNTCNGKMMIIIMGFLLVHISVLPAVEI